MKFTLLDSNPPPLEGKVAALERTLGAQLPKDYRAFLSEFNGGRPEPGGFDFVGVDGYQNSSVIRRFFSIDADPDDDLEADYLFYTGADRIPRNVLPVAFDPGGNRICMSLAGPDRGCMYFWDHELELDRSGYENLALLAKSFTKFLAKLHEA